jgi:hypothetical protein
VVNHDTTVAAVMNAHNVTRGYARYHIGKFADPLLHAGKLLRMVRHEFVNCVHVEGTHGGARHWKFSEQDQALVEDLIW